jgi:hypothetical protein
MRHAQLVILVGIGLILASLGNGAAGYLKRIGLLDHSIYVNYVATYCQLPREGRGSFGCICMHEPLDEQSNSRPGVGERPEPKYIYQNFGSERWLKLGKDALFGGFLLVSLYLIGARRVRMPSLADSWPPWLLMVSVAVGFAISLVFWGGSFAIIGLRSFEFLAIVLLGGWAAGGMQYFAYCAGWLVILQVLLVALELTFGIPISSCPHWFRAAGTMVLPNTLGAVAVVALAFYASFTAIGTRFFVLLLATALLLAASGSGTGLVALFALLAMLALRRMTGSRQRMAVLASVLLGVLMVLQLPAITHRPDIYDSLFAKGGRVDTFNKVLRVSSPTDTLIGHGLGYGTNTASNLAAISTAPAPSVLGAHDRFFADSTVTVLLTQLGIVGITVFYWLLGWAYWRDPMARPAYLVIVLVSLTMNVTELFPINFMLGLLLAHTIANTGATRARL